MTHAEAELKVEDDIGGEEIETSESNVSSGVGNFERPAQLGDIVSIDSAMELVDVVVKQIEVADVVDVDIVEAAVSRNDKDLAACEQQDFERNSQKGSWCVDTAQRTIYCKVTNLSAPTKRKSPLAEVPVATTYKPDSTHKPKPKYRKLTSLPGVTLTEIKPTKITPVEPASDHVKIVDNGMLRKVPKSTIYIERAPKLTQSSSRPPTGTHKTKSQSEAAKHVLIPKVGAKPVQSTKGSVPKKSSQGSVERLGSNNVSRHCAKFREAMSVSKQVIKGVEKKRGRQSVSKASVGSRVSAKSYPQNGAKVVVKTNGSLNVAEPKEDRRLNPDAKVFVPSNVTFTLHANADRFVPMQHLHLQIEKMMRNLRVNNPSCAMHAWEVNVL
jgi:hypothetical protein